MKTRAKQAKLAEKPMKPKAPSKKPTKRKAKKGPAKDDARKPKKPPTAFFYYLYALALSLPSSSPFYPN